MYVANIPCETTIFTNINICILAIHDNLDTEANFTVVALLPDDAITSGPRKSLQTVGNIITQGTQLPVTDKECCRCDRHNNTMQSEA